MRTILPEMMTCKEVAQSLGICEHTVRQYAKNGKLRTVRFSRRTHRYRKDDVEALISKMATGR